MPWESGAGEVREAKAPSRDIWKEFLRGGYPELVANPQRDIYLWHASYNQTYLERDVRTVRQVGDLMQFQSFLRALAARSAQLLKLTDIARALGVAVNTIKAWLSVLEATSQVIVLRPYFPNIDKRLVKTPKVYFTDVGTLCYLTGLKDPEHAASGPMGRAIIGAAVLVEIVKALTHRGVDPRVYFWRTATGTEVDIVVEFEGRLCPIEVKLTAPPRPSMASLIDAFHQSFGAKAMHGYVLNLGDVRLPLGRRVTALPFAQL